MRQHKQTLIDCNTFENFKVLQKHRLYSSGSSEQNDMYPCKYLIVLHLGSTPSNLILFLSYNMLKMTQIRYFSIVFQLLVSHCVHSSLFNNKVTLVHMQYKINRIWLVVSMLILQNRQRERFKTLMLWRNALVLSVLRAASHKVICGHVGATVC